MSVNTKMTAIADEIRVLSGTTDPMGLDAMATNVGNANDEIADQEVLMEQIKTALQGKAAGGGSGGSEPIELCTYQCSDTSQFLTDVLYYGLNDDGIVVMKSVTTNDGNTLTFDAVKGTYVIHRANLGTAKVSVNGEWYNGTSNEYVGGLTAVRVTGDMVVSIS